MSGRSLRATFSPGVVKGIATLGGGAGIVGGAVVKLAYGIGLTHASISGAAIGTAVVGASALLHYTLEG